MPGPRQPVCGHVPDPAVTSSESSESRNILTESLNQDNDLCRSYRSTDMGVWDDAGRALMPAQVQWRLLTERRDEGDHTGRAE